MIIVSIGGGLGNQMFEYAFYEMLKHKYPQQIIKLDIMHTYGKAHNGYEIENIFQLKADDCDLKELIQLTDYYPLDAPHYKLWNILFKIRRKIFGYKKSCIRLSNGTEFESKFFELDNENSYFCLGVFANYNYFSEIEEHIKNIYSFPEISDCSNLRYKEMIEKSTSVGMHIRRGDYLEWGVELASEQYYRQAIGYIQSKVGECNFFVFTDDKDYVQQRYNDIENLTIVEGNVAENSFRDMQLMSLCKHNIIANSTFSFWGAFLNKNNEKIVIAPNLPFTGCKNLFACDDWIII